MHSHPVSALHALLCLGLHAHSPCLLHVLFADLLQICLYWYPRCKTDLQCEDTGLLGNFHLNAPEDTGLLQVSLAHQDMKGCPPENWNKLWYILKTFFSVLLAIFPIHNSYKKPYLYYLAGFRYLHRAFLTLTRILTLHLKPLLSARIPLWYSAWQQWWQTWWGKVEKHRNWSEVPF